MSEKVFRTTLKKRVRQIPRRWLPSGFLEQYNQKIFKVDKVNGVENPVSRMNTRIYRVIHTGSRHDLQCGWTHSNRNPLKFT